MRDGAWPVESRCPGSAMHGDVGQSVVLNHDGAGLAGAAPSARSALGLRRRHRVFAHRDCDGEGSPVTRSDLTAAVTHEIESPAVRTCVAEERRVRWTGSRRPSFNINDARQVSDST